MSYDIIYNKQFVKLRKTGEVIPMLLAGSSNCFEIGLGGRNGRRVRSWDSLRYYNRKGKISEKPEIILKNLDAELNRYIREQRKREDGGKPSHVKAHFGWYAAIVVGSGACYDTSWNNYRSQFVNGIKKAMTIEQLNNLGVNLIFSSGGFEKDPNGKPDSIHIHTEMEYFEEVKKWLTWRDNGGSQFYLSFTPYNTDRVLERLRGNNHRIPKEKTKVEQDHYYVLSSEIGYLVKYTRSGYRYSYYKNGGKKFMTKEEADKYRKQLVANERYKSRDWKVEKVEGKATFWV